MPTNIVVCSDIHYIHRADHSCPIPERRTELGLTLLRSVLEKARDEIKADAVVLLGDLVDNGDASGAEDDLKELHRALEEAGLPYFAVPGNHDGEVQAFLEIFGTEPGLHQVGDATCFFFVDEYGADDVAVRDAASMQEMAEAFKKSSAARILFQHSPVLPKIESPYPYNLRDYIRVGELYDAVNVTLSVSGHYHRGMAATPLERTHYLINPALCEAPFQFTHLRVVDGAVSAEALTVALDGQCIND